MQIQKRYIGMMLFFIKNFLYDFVFDSKFQTLNEEKISLELNTARGSRIDSSTTSSTSYESRHKTIHQHFHESSSSNEYSSLSESSSENSKSQFTQIENRQLCINTSSERHIVFDSKIDVFESPRSPRESCLERSLSEQPTSPPRVDHLKGKHLKYK